MSPSSISSRPPSFVNWADDDEDDFDFEAWKATADTSAPTVDSLPPLQLPPAEVEPLLFVCGNEKINDAALWTAEPTQQPEAPKIDLSQIDEWCGKRTAAWRAVNDRPSRPAYPTMSAHEGGLLCLDQRINYASNWQKTKVKCGLNCKFTAMLMLSSLRMVTVVEPEEVADVEAEIEVQTTVEEASGSSHQVSDSEEEDSPRSTPPSLADDECTVIEDKVADNDTGIPTQQELLEDSETKTQETLRTPDIVSASEDSPITTTTDSSDDESSDTKDDTTNIDTTITTQQDHHEDAETHRQETLHTPETVSSPEASIVTSPTDLSNDELAVTTDNITNSHATAPQQEALLERVEAQTRRTLRTPDYALLPQACVITTPSLLSDDACVAIIDETIDINAITHKHEECLDGCKMKTKTQGTLRTPEIGSTPKLRLITTHLDPAHSKSHTQDALNTMCSPDEGYYSATSTITSPTLATSKDTSRTGRDKTSFHLSLNIILAIARKSNHKHSRTDSMDALKKLRQRGEVEKNNDGPLEAIDLTHNTLDSDEKPGVVTYLSHAAATGWGYVTSMPWTMTAVVATGVIVGGALHFARRR
ncbi:hypothetical protein BKA63DRAFT_570054 [Paraphoma chrysanthemicola]|nr:hypothetical protein BKA63DRAFT_570054 [Paraphoma chrysanthemicola]